MHEESGHVGPWQNNQQIWQHGVTTRLGSKGPENLSRATHANSRRRPQQTIRDLPAFNRSITFPANQWGGVIDDPTTSMVLTDPGEFRY